MIQSVFFVAEAVLIKFTLYFFFSVCALCTQFLLQFIFSPSLAESRIVHPPGNPSPPSLLRPCFSKNARRLAKEQKMYTQENQDQKLKLDKFIANNADEWDIKNGVCCPSPPYRTSVHPCTSRILRDLGRVSFVVRTEILISDGTETDAGGIREDDHRHQ